MRQLQFKFDPLRAESAGICLFHQRWIKTFYTQPFEQLCIKYGLILQELFGRSFTKKPHFRHSKNGKWLFCAMKGKTPQINIVCHSNMHPCAQYEIIWTNYAMNVAIRLIIWLESHESPCMIAHFLEHFLKIISVLQVYYFSWKLGRI